MPQQALGYGVLEENKLKAAVCREVGQPLSIEEVAIAEPEQGEVKVKLMACAICHSDIMFIDGHWEGALPAVYGHEASGIVESVGPGVSDISVGEPCGGHADSLMWRLSLLLAFDRNPV